MFFRKLFALFFVGFLIFGVFGSFGRGADNRYEAAYRQGFVDGQQVAAGKEGIDAPAAPANLPGAQVYVRDRSFFFPGFGFLLLCLVPLFFLGFVFRGAGRRHHGRGLHHHPCGAWGHGPWGPPAGGTEKSPDDIDDGPSDPLKYT